MLSMDNFLADGNSEGIEKRLRLPLYAGLKSLGVVGSSGDNLFTDMLLIEVFLLLSGVVVVVTVGGVVVAAELSLLLLLVSLKLRSLMGSNGDSA